MCSNSALMFIYHMGVCKDAVAGPHQLRCMLAWQVGYIDDRFGPLGLAAVVTLALTSIFIISVVDFTLDLIQKP